MSTVSHKLSTINHKLFREATEYMIGGVNSPVRAFKAVGGAPVFVKRAKGSKFYDERGGAYIDYCGGWGALILGHAHPAVIHAVQEAAAGGVHFGAPTRGETELAVLIAEAFPSIEKLRLVNSGTEAVMGAIRLARAYTKRDDVIRFEGSYHGHADYLLNCPGVPDDFTKHTRAVPYNDEGKLEEVVKKYGSLTAAMIVEPVAANEGVVVPGKGFLRALRSLADKYGIVLIFDEVITGFRLAYGGAQERFGIRSDLTCLGKIIGGGLPVGAFGGRADIMRLLAPEGNVYQGGTFSGNPPTVAAGIATLKILKKDNPYAALESLTKKLCDGVCVGAERHGVKAGVAAIASVFNIAFKSRRVFAGFFHSLLHDGVYLSPSPDEACFLSTAHSGEDIEKTQKAVERAFEKLH